MLYSTMLDASSVRIVAGMIQGAGIDPMTITVVGLLLLVVAVVWFGSRPN